MERADYIAGLRAVADWLEQHPDVALPEDKLSCFSVDTKEEAAVVARAMRTFEKKFSDWSMSLEKSFGPIKLHYYFTRENVCVRKVIGVETIPAKFVEAVAEHVVPASTKEIVEWECQSILAVEREQSQPVVEAPGETTLL